MKNLKDILTIVIFVCLVWVSIMNFITINLAQKAIDNYEIVKTNYCDLFGKYNEYFTMLDNPYNMIDRTAEYSRYFYFKDEFLKYCK